MQFVHDFIHSPPNQVNVTSPMPPSPSISCPHCRTNLVIRAAAQATSGPCPMCHGFIEIRAVGGTANARHQWCPPAPGLDMAAAMTAPAAATSPVRSQWSRRGIAPDNAVSFHELERRDTMKILRMIACFLLSGCLIFLVIEWFSRAGG